MITGDNKFEISLFQRNLLEQFENVWLCSLPLDLPKEEENQRNMGVVAYRPRKDTILIGCKLPPLAHEIAHMVEMNDFSRLLKDDWGFKNCIDGGSPGSFFAAFARETRVRAIQSYMDGRPGFNNDYWFAQAHIRMPFGRFEHKKQVRDWVDGMFEKTSSGLESGSN